MPAGSGAGGSSYGAGSSSYGAGGPGYASTATGVPANPWPNQPPTRSAPGRLPRGSAAYSGRRPRRPRLRLLLAFLAGLVVVLLILVIGGYFYLDGKLNRSNVLASYAGQPAAGAGSNWLITGSDSRQGLTRKQERKYHTGIDVSGQRSDTPAAAAPTRIATLANRALMHAPPSENVARPRPSADSSHKAAGPAQPVHSVHARFASSGTAAASR